ncbi:MAG: hypothetical protein JO340_02095 [Acidobacteriaceae bacterium]|nr:hypothetical protein [Acidobacteriaceae bacterium]
MKLRLRQNSLRLRVNRPEVENLAAGGSLEQRVQFPDGAALAYIFESASSATASATFRDGVIRVSAPAWQVQDWARGEAIGLYFQLSAGGEALHVAIEKDLECLDAPPEERDANAFRRTGKNC